MTIMMMIGDGVDDMLTMMMLMGMTNKRSRRIMMIMAMSMNDRTYQVSPKMICSGLR